MEHSHAWAAGAGGGNHLHVNQHRTKPVISVTNYCELAHGFNDASLSMMSICQPLAWG